MNKINKKFGFTLVELLVVISIIGILTIITASSFINSQVRSRDAYRKASLKSLADALSTYYGDYGVYPTSSTVNINTLISNEGEFSYPASGNKIIYMKKVPKEKTSGISQILYEVSSTAKSYRLYVNLENSEDNDCYTETVCDGLSYDITNGCCYIITSSNIGATSSLL